MSVLTCCHICHIDHQRIMMTMKLAALISQIKTFEGSMINSSNINFKTFAQYNH